MPTATPGTPATITFPTPSAPPTGQRHPSLLNRLADALRSRHYSRRTEQTYLREAGHDIRTIQELLGHTDVGTTMISTPVLTKGGQGVRSPGDAL
jgi:integrase